MTVFEHPVYEKLSDYRFYLCSTSPRRKEILEMIGFHPEICPSDFEENLPKSDFTVEEYVRETAKGKCLAVWDQLKKEGKTDKVFLLSADTVVENEGIIYEKPKTKEENFRAICKMRDSKQPVRVLSGVVMLLSDETTQGKPDNCKITVFTEVTEILMERSVSDAFVHQYTETGEGLQVAGGFRIQGFGALMMQGVNGDYYNVVGLPRLYDFREGSCSIKFILYKMSAIATLRLASRPAMRVSRGPVLRFAALTRFYSSKFPEHTVIGMPALSPTMTQGSLVKWHKKVGDALSPGEAIAEVETDKASMDFEFQEEGFLAKILVPDGTQDIPVGKPVAVYVEESGDVAAFENFTAADAGDSSSPAPAAKEEEAPKETKEAPKESSKESSKEASKPKSTSSAPSGRIFASPLAKNIALEKGISLKEVKGTGPNGRIVAKDVENYKPAAAAAPAASPSAAPASAAYTDIPLTTMRKVISKRLTESKQTSPDYIVSSSISVSKLLKLRASLNSNANDRYRLSVNDLLIKAIAKACERVPEVNAYYLENEGVIRQFSNVDVSVAVATPAGLITPIVKNAHTKGLETISKEVKDLGKRAKENKLSPEEFQGGTITISNLGMNHAVTLFTSILNPPQSAILAIGTVEKKAVPDKASPHGFVFDDVINITGTFDHRTVDGAKGGDYIRALKTIVENPLEMLLFKMDGSSGLDEVELTYLVIFSTLITLLLLVSIFSLIYYLFFRDSLYDASELESNQICDVLKYSPSNYRNDALYKSLSEIDRLRFILARQFFEISPPVLHFNTSGEIDTTYLLIRDRGISSFYFETYQDQMSELVQNLEDAELDEVSETTALLQPKKPNYRQAQFKKVPYFVEDLTEITFVGRSQSSAILNLPIPIRNRKNDTVYFETKLYSFDHNKCTVAIGLCTKPYPNFQMPGTCPYSVAVQTDGFLRLSNKPFLNDPDLPVILPQLIEGDVVGIGYKASNGSVYITHNGKRIVEAVRNFKTELYPCIGAVGAPCKVTVNLGQMGFVFIEANVKKLGFCENQNEGAIGAPPFYSPKTIKNDILLDQGEQLPPHYPSDEETFFGPKPSTEKQIRVRGGTPDSDPPEYLAETNEKTDSIEDPSHTSVMEPTEYEQRIHIADPLSPAMGTSKNSGSDWFIQKSLDLLKASPDDTTVSITYTHSKSGSKSTTKPPKAVIKFKTFNPKTGICLTFKTYKSKEFNRLVNVLGPRGSSMTKTDNQEKKTIHLDGFSSVMSNVEFKPEEAPAQPVAAAQEAQESAGKKKSKKKGKKR
ncbi:hypothetical protein OGAPHI_000850 [Ogataea philodendri]|uniref:Acetyltransferase component of pyruvate dehydrogenase complex n=1 Tax=Ogataea philodendri TaxID=1378263 RepID=A0A9P8PGQ9_9ASCO|nr:uncharacterized protein OGAPHI_000850 [Ogataea philodendri]KAH3671139.1 hypothetical protein OGAPHI_000850 [Ogataea philodendri]